MRRLLPFVFAAVVFAGCYKKDDPVTAAPAGTGKLKLEFSNMVGDQPLVLSAGRYQDANGDSFQVTMYKYYISNISVTTDSGKVYTEPDSYHLIDQSNTDSWRFALDSLPTGNYTSIHFLIGVDSAMNTGSPKTGDLDVTRGMLWDWNTGYVMAKMEGKSSVVAANGGIFEYHIAGFSGVNNTLHWVTLPFPEKAVVGSGTTVPDAHIFSDVSEWFKTPYTIDLSRVNDVSTISILAKNLSDNYADMFHVDHIDN